MNLQFYFKQMETSQALINHTTRKLEQLENLVLNEIPGTIRFHASPLKQKAHFTFRARDRSRVDVTVRAGDLYEAVDLAIEKLQRALRKRKEKRHARRNRFYARRLHQKANQMELFSRLDEHSIDADFIVRTA